MERLLSTTATQATSCLVPGVARANWMERGLGLLHSALVSRGQLIFQNIDSKMYNKMFNNVISSKYLPTPHCYNISIGKKTWEGNTAVFLEGVSRALSPIMGL